MPVNEKSLKNLTPREPEYGESKRSHNIMLTDTAWRSLQEFAKLEDIASVSELVERFARKAIPPKSYRNFVKGS